MDRRPTTTLSYAQSLDGRIATALGDSQWISGEETLRLAHELRGSHDAILVGVGTILSDDPHLTCRLPGGRDPHRVVLDSRLRTPVESKVARPAPTVRTTIFCANPTPEKRRAELETAGIAVVPVASDATGLDLRAVLDALVDMGVASLLVEGGSGVVTSFFRAGLVDRLVLVSAPLVIGAGTDAVGDLGVRRLGEARRGRTTAVRQAGNDVVWEMEFERG
ncbi:MAG: RibD family protein [Spirochaetota bacterium]